MGASHHVRECAHTEYVYIHSVCCFCCRLYKFASIHIIKNAFLWALVWVCTGVAVPMPHAGVWYRGPGPDRPSLVWVVTGSTALPKTCLPVIWIQTGRLGSVQPQQRHGGDKREAALLNHVHVWVKRTALKMWCATFECLLLFHTSLLAYVWKR